MANGYPPANIAINVENPALNVRHFPNSFHHGVFHILLYVYPRENITNNPSIGPCPDDFPLFTINQYQPFYTIWLFNIAMENIGKSPF